MFCNIVRFDISDQMAAALANGFLTDFGILRADSPEQRRIDPQEIAREKVRISTKLEQERNAEFHSSNQPISQLDTCVEVKMEENDVEDMLTSPDISLTVGSGNSWSYSTMKQ